MYSSQRYNVIGLAVRLTVGMIVAFTSVLPAEAKIELVTLPERSSCQLTIYNSADITLVRDERNLTFKKGKNRIEYSWVGTLIDPTSVQIEPLPGAPPFQIVDTDFPPGVQNTLVWNIESNTSGSVAVRISYFTSGITWSADYGLVLNTVEKEGTLSGFVTVTNNSGEDYENSQVRLIVGKIHLVEEIHDLATINIDVYRSFRGKNKSIFESKRRNILDAEYNKNGEVHVDIKAKEVKKESLSDYFIYTVEGRETIENKWSKRLPSMTVANLPVKSVFKFENYRLGPEPIRFVTFKNDKESKMGKEPIPDGTLHVMKIDDRGNLLYLGNTAQKYVPIDGTVEVNLGPDREVQVEAKLFNAKTTDFAFNHRGDIAGWDSWSTYKVRIRNFKSAPIRVEMKRKHDPPFEILTDLKFEKEDREITKFTLDIPAHSDREFTYTVRAFNGTRGEGK